ncbi:MAG: hypothetical protein JW751_07550 [Polyangiaceae bacterium]|nr:hypothetical protein [Polyangiaceae bacterium]
MSRFVPPALLHLAEVRVDVPGDGPIAEDLGCVAAGPRVGLLGHWEPLFRVLTGEARVLAGRAEIAGVDAEQAVALGVVGVARCAVPLPSGWRGLDYVCESARLAGLGRAAETAAKSTLARLGLERVQHCTIRGLSPVERRALLLAHAVVNDPPVLAVEDPLDDLEPGPATALRSVLEQASLGRHLVLSTRETASGTPTEELLRSCNELLARDARGRVDPASVGGSPALAGARWSVIVLGGARRLADALIARGAVLEAEHLLDERTFDLTFTAGCGSARVPNEEVGTAPAPEFGGRLVLRIPTTNGADVVIGLAHELHCPIVELVGLG